MTIISFFLWFLVSEKLKSFRKVINKGFKKSWLREKPVINTPSLALGCSLQLSAYHSLKSSKDIFPGICDGPSNTPTSQETAKKVSEIKSLEFLSRG